MSGSRGIVNDSCNGDGGCGGGSNGDCVCRFVASYLM